MYQPDSSSPYSKVYSDLIFADIVIIGALKLLLDWNWSSGVRQDVCRVNLRLDVIQLKLHSGLCCACQSKQTARMFILIYDIQINKIKSHIPPTGSLFKNILVFENCPLKKPIKKWSQDENTGLILELKFCIKHEYI